jgi:hypothetical protein
MDPRTVQSAFSRLLVKFQKPTQNSANEALFDYVLAEREEGGGGGRLLSPNVQAIAKPRTPGAAHPHFLYLLT